MTGSGARTTIWPCSPGASLPPSSKTWLDVREAVRSKATDLGLGPTTFARCAPPRTERIRAYEDFIAEGEVKRPPRQHANPIRKTPSGLQLTRQLYCVFAALSLSLSFGQQGKHGEMGYLGREDRLQRRRDPQLVLPGAQSVIVSSLFYWPGKNGFPWNESGAEVRPNCVSCCRKPHLKCLTNFFS